MDQPFVIIFVAGVELVVLTVTTGIYYYESIRGAHLGHPVLERKAERMFGLGSGLVVVNVAAIALLLWLPDVALVSGFAKVLVTLLLVVIAYCCTRWALGCFVDPAWYFIPWKTGRHAQEPTPRP